MDNAGPKRDTAGHRQRLRTKFLESGLGAFHNYEIIELLLSLGTPRSDVKPQAKELINRFKTLRGVLDASESELQAVPGIGPNNILGLKLFKEVAGKYLEEEAGEKPIGSSPKAIYDYLRHTMRGLRKEVFKVVYLDTKNRIIAVKDLFEGTVSTSAVYPREVVKRAIAHAATGIVLAHNHPSGDPAPSTTDEEITQQLTYACRLLDITVHDHIIIGENRYFSFADEGLIETYKQNYEKVIRAR